MREFDVFDPATLDDPYPGYDRLRRIEPVHRIAGTDFYVVSSWELVLEATRRVEDFSSHLTAALIQDAAGRPTIFDMDGGGHAVHVLATADDPVHLRHRKLVLPTLVARRIRALEPQVQVATRAMWRTHARDDRIEWMAAMADRLPMTMVARLIGLPAKDAEQLVAWGYGSTEMLGGVVTVDNVGDTVAAAVALAGYLYDRFERASASPGDDLLGDLVRACVAGELDRDVAVLMLVQLVGAGGESTAGLIGNAARLLAENAVLQEQVRADRNLLVPLLEESLRLESPFRAHHRHVVADTTLGGVELPAGSHLLLSWGAANRDPAVFDDPDQVRLDRPNLKTHLAFGKGTHFCVGAALARMEARAAIQTLLDNTTRFEFHSAQWLPSILVRRHRRLELSVTHGD